jgi:hypothetical protein
MLGKNLRPVKTDQQTADAIARLIHKSPPPWLATTISTVVIPALRNEIEGYENFPTIKSIRNQIESAEKAAQTLIRAMADGLIGNLLAQHWRLQKHIPTIAVRPEDHHDYSELDEDIWRQLKRADHEEYRTLLNLLAQVSNVLQRVQGALPRYSRAKPHPDTPSPQVTCATWVGIVWKAVHNANAPKSARSWRVCDALWQAAHGQKIIPNSDPSRWRFHQLEASRAREGLLLARMQRAFDAARWQPNDR